LFDWSNILTIFHLIGQSNVNKMLSELTSDGMLSDGLVYHPKKKIQRIS